MKEKADFRLHLKRLFDVVLSLIGTFFLLIPSLIVMIVLKVTSKDPVFFKQYRPGKDCKIFTLYKFRTMKDLKNSEGKLLPDERRLSRFGKFLRKFSLDEIPGLLNVLKGDMSIVGPRPLLVEYLDKYSSEQARRHEMKPGLSGWAQINGRNAITWEEKFNYDIWYVDNWNLWLDVKIIFVTIIKVIKGEGISQLGYDTMEKFKGTSKNEKK